jgi:multiple sugar transport system substrate-binding protein
MVKEETALFEKANPGWTVKNVYVPYANLPTKLINGASAKSGPDVAIIDVGNEETLAAAGVLAPLDKYWDAYQSKATFSPSALHRYGGKIYQVGGFVDVLGLYYNQDLMKKLGIATPPTTMSELEVDMAKAKAAGLQGITITGVPNVQGEYQAYPWLTSKGFDYATHTASSLQSAFSMVQGWVNKGYLSKDTPTLDQGTSFTQFTNGNVLFAEAGDFEEANAKAAAKFKYGVVPLPLGSSGKVYASGSHPSIGAFSKNKSMAWKYIESSWLSDNGELASLKYSGGLPANSKLATQSAITSDPINSQYIKVVANQASPFPSTSIPPKSVAAAQTLVAQTWSAVLGQQVTPAAAATKVADGLAGLYGK